MTYKIMTNYDRIPKNLNLRERERGGDRERESMFQSRRNIIDVEC